MYIPCSALQVYALYFVWIFLRTVLTTNIKNVFSYHG